MEACSKTIPVYPLSRYMALRTLLNRASQIFIARNVWSWSAKGSAETLGLSCKSFIELEHRRSHSDGTLIDNVEGRDIARDAVASE